jgi:hypothetical protein
VTGSASFLIAFALTVEPSAAAVKCVLPAPDYQKVDVSPFNFEGSIERVRGDQIRLRWRSGSSSAATVELVLRKKSQLFSVFGGDVERSDLATGQVVRIWLENCGREKQSGLQVIAVLQLSSKKPGERFPETKGLPNNRMNLTRSAPQTDRRGLCRLSVLNGRSGSKSLVGIFHPPTLSVVV